MDDELLSGKRVLVVEDEMLVAMQIEDMLSDLGCTSITVAGTIETALDQIDGGKFDLATLDLNLNATRSLPVAEALGSRRIPYALATGYSAKGIEEALADCPILRKPYSFQQFKEVIRKLLSDGVPKPLSK